MGDLTADVIAGLGRLKVTQGARAGEALAILPWQRRFIRGVVRSRTAALSVSRGAGKTTLCAALAVAGLVGPLRQARGEVIAVAASFPQARILFEHVAAFMAPAVAAKPTRFRVQDSASRAAIEDKATGCRLRCIASDPRRAHGLAPVVVLADEPAQWPESTGERMVAALRTAAGKVPGSRFVALGTRPARREHWFERMLAGGADYAQTHAARPDDPPFRRRTWARANPSLNHLPDLEAAIRAEAAEARRDPSMLAAFKALRLNQGVADTEQSTLLDAATWELIEGEAERAGPHCWGVDLGTSAAQSAVAAYWPATGRLEAVAAFPSAPTFAERGLRDGVGSLYARCAERGELIACGGEAVDVAALCRAALKRFGRPAALAADRWREAELRDALDAAGVPPAALELRGQGFKDGGEDVRTFRRACLDGRVVPARSLLLRSAMGEARVALDPAGNAKLAKGTEGQRRLRARDDAAAAAIAAVSLGVRRELRPAPRVRYRGLIG